MSLWEYKVITSGKGGFATPALLEKFLNDLGRDEWEIIHFQTPPDNFLAFTGLVRRSTQRDWTLQDAAAAAAKAEADKLRVEFEAKFKAAASNAPAGGTEERAPSFLEEKSAPDDGFRKPVDTSRDDDPEVADDDKDDWDKLTAAEEEELPSFFDAIKPHMRRNQRGPGMSVGVDYLAKKWDQNEDDLKGALEECGFVMPVDEDSKAEYLEYDGDLYWLNINRRGELWINTKEKPRPVFRPVKGARVEIEAPAPKEDSRHAPEPKSVEEKQVGDAASEQPAAEPSEGRPPRKEGSSSRQSGAPLPEGPALLDKIRPHMRRNRRGPGGSGSTTFLSRALRTNEETLKAAFVALGLTVPTTATEKPVYVEISNDLWWLNLDSRGGLWINGREKKSGETVASANEAAVETPAEAVPGATGSEVPPATDAAPANVVEATPPGLAAAADSVPVVTGDLVAGSSTPIESAPTPASDSNLPPALAAVRSFLKETRTGAHAGKIERLAEEAGKPADALLASLVDAGLKLPEKPREKPAYLEHAGEVHWLSMNAKGEIWLNAKPAKLADKDGDEGESTDDKPKRGRSRKADGEGAKETDSPPADASSI
ncbi:hypothetical protein [Horticoccus sp. 23ND18S-11]|uniref:hypothetical protein n=1 Tax=Horticoccus sp. 23ND18S-11 TaxID=3391832 RepID=UPI0039C9EB6A